MQRLLLILLVPGWLYACLMCSGGAIYVTTTLDATINNAHLHTIRVNWDLDPVFSQLVLGDFDRNRNHRFDPSEVDDVLSNLLPMEEFNFFLDLSLNGQELQLKTLDNFDVTFSRGIVSYRFDIPVDMPLDRIVSLQGGFKDQEARDGSVFYRFAPTPIRLSDSTHTELTVQTRELTDQDGWVTQRIDAQFKPLLPCPTVDTKPLEAAQPPQPPNALSRTLKEVTDTVHGYLVVMQESSSPGAIAMILLFSLLYGMLHAAGPGHGKMLVASYFLSHDRSYAKATTLGLMIAAVHVFSALILTMIVYFLIDSVFSRTIEEAGRIITVGSGALIVAIALYLFRQKWRHYTRRPLIKTFQAAPGQTAFSALHTPSPHGSSCGCHSCKTTTTTTDLSVVVLAGIVPCPGTVIIFMFALSMGLYAVGIASAVVMSLGMGITIALTAIIGTGARHSSRRFGKHTLMAVEFGSLAVMVALGSFLLFG